MLFKYKYKSGYIHYSSPSLHSLPLPIVTLWLIILSGKAVDRFMGIASELERVGAHQGVAAHRIIVLKNPASSHTDPFHTASAAG